METQIWHQHLKTLAEFPLASIHFGCHCFICTCNSTVLLESGDLDRQCQRLQDHQDSAWLHQQVLPCLAHSGQAL